MTRDVCTALSLVLAHPGSLLPRKGLFLSPPFSAEHPTVPRWDRPVVSSKKVRGTKGETWGETQTLNIQTKGVVSSWKGFLGSAGGFTAPGWLCGWVPVPPHSSSPPAPAPQEIRATDKGCPLLHPHFCNPP